MQTTALVLVDIQNDYFAGGKWPVPGMAGAAKNAARLLAHARATGMAVFHIRHEIQSETAPFFAAGSAGAQINTLVAPADDRETVILKHHPNSFLNTDLAARLSAAGITDLILCGAMSQMCIDSTARAARDLGYRVRLAHDACAARALEFGGLEIPAQMVHGAFMAALSPGFVTLETTDQIVTGG